MVEDKGICVGEHWTDAGEQDADSVAMQAKDGEVMGIVGWNIMEPGKTVEGLRAFLDYYLADPPNDKSEQAQKSMAIYLKYAE